MLPGSKNWVLHLHHSRQELLLLNMLRRAQNDYIMFSPSCDEQRAILFRYHCCALDQRRLTGFDRVVNHS